MAETKESFHTEIQVELVHYFHDKISTYSTTYDDLYLIEMVKYIDISKEKLPIGIEIRNSGERILSICPSSKL